MFYIIDKLKNNKIKITKPNGPILGASEDVAPTSPPTHLMYTADKIKNNK